MTNFLIYRYNDMVYQMVTGLGIYLKSPLTYDSNLINTNYDFLTQYLFLFLYRFIHPVSLQNLFILFAVALCFYFSYLFFIKLLKNHLLAGIFALLYSVSTYNLYRIQSFTPALLLTFVIPLFFLLPRVSKIQNLLVGLFIVFTLITGSYLGFFLFMLAGFSLLFDLIYKKINLHTFFINIFYTFVPVFLLLSLFFGRNLVNNLAIFNNYSLNTARSDTSTIYRPIEDWYNFSFRPWYFFIPPNSSLFFGDLSDNLYKTLKNTGYYLADDYAEDEMAGSYMGWHFIFGLFFTLYLLFTKSKYSVQTYKWFPSVYENKEIIFKSLFIIVCILLISGPPSFTINSITVYTPSFLLYQILPVFRSLTRWSVVIYFLVLVINSILVKDLWFKLHSKIYKIVFLVLFVVLNFVVFSIKLNAINIAKPPEEITYLKNISTERYKYAVYPIGDYYSLFWILSHEKFLINPANLVFEKEQLDSNKYSETIISRETLSDLKARGAKFLVYYERNVGKSSKNINARFEINPGIRSIGDIKMFFDSNLGLPVFVGNGVFIYKI